MNQQTVRIHGSDWKLADVQDEIEWCQRQAWQLEPYQATENHSHCLVCSWTLMPSADPAIGIGYRNAKHSWLCQECFGQFIAVT